MQANCLKAIPNLFVKLRNAFVFVLPAPVFLSPINGAWAYMSNISGMISAPDATAAATAPRLV